MSLRSYFDTIGGGERFCFIPPFDARGPLLHVVGNKTEWTHFHLEKLQLFVRPHTILEIFATALKALCYLMELHIALSSHIKPYGAS